MCEALALVTERIRFGTAIADIYLRHPSDYAQTAALVHELSGGRFRFGVGVSHGRTNERLGVSERSPLAASRGFVEELRSAPRIGELPPVVLAGLRKRMVALAGEIADGVVLNYLVSPDYNQRAMESLAVGAARAGRTVDDVDRPQLIVCSVDPDRDRAIAAAKARRQLDVGPARALHREADDRVVVEHDDAHDRCDSERDAEHREQGAAGAGEEGAPR